MNIPENIFNNLTEGQKEAIEAAKSPEELLSLAKESGYELSLEDLAQVAGGRTHFGYNSPELESSDW